MPFDFAVVAEAVPVLLRGLEVTAIVSVIGIPLGGLAGTLAAYAVQSRSRVLAGLARGYVAMVRNVPYLILVYLSFFGLPKLGVPASAMAVAIGCTALYTGGYFCEILRAALHSVPRGQSGAALSLGMVIALTALEFLVAFLQAFVFAVLACIYLNDVVNLGHGH